VHDGQAKACPIILGCKKGIEDVGDVFSADALTVVANRQGILRLTGWSPQIHASFHGPGATWDDEAEAAC
jgi:hypothetical protein